MTGIPENVWKHRFVEYLVTPFFKTGLDSNTALEDAYVHADHHYPKRGTGTPEKEAEAVYSSLAEK